MRRQLSLPTRTYFPTLFGFRSLAWLSPDSVLLHATRSSPAYYWPASPSPVSSSWRLAVAVAAEAGGGGEAVGGEAGAGGGMLRTLPARWSLARRGRCEVQ